MRARVRLCAAYSRPLAWALACALAFTALPALAQEGHEGHEGHGGTEAQGEMSPEMAAMMQAWAKAMTPGEPHEMLASQAGTWKLTVKFWMEPGGEAQVSEATSVRQMIMGGRYLEEKVDGVSMGQPFQGHGITGYDNVSGEYWSTWIDNMSTGVMMLHGKADDTGKVTYHGEISDPMTGGATKVKSVWWAEGADKEHYEMYMSHGDEMVKSMEITSVRQ